MGALYERRGILTLHGVASMLPPSLSGLSGPGLRKAARRTGSQTVRVHLADIGEEGLDVAFDLSREDFETLLDDPHGAVKGGEAGVQVKVRLDKIQETTVLVRGSAVADLGYECARCTADRQMGLEVGIDAVMVPSSEGKGQIEGEDEEFELTADEMDVTFYEGMEIDLSDIVREAIFLEMPAYPSCGIEPKESCPDYQANIGQKAQEMKDNDGDLRWEALKAIKARMAGAQGDD